MQSSLYICMFEKSNPFTVSGRLSRFHAVTGSLRCCFVVPPPSKQCVSRSEFRGAQRSLPAIDFMSNSSPRKVGKSKSLTLSLCLKCFRHYFSHVVQQKNEKNHLGYSNKTAIGTLWPSSLKFGDLSTKVSRYSRRRGFLSLCLRRFLVSCFLQDGCSWLSLPRLPKQY